MSTVYVLTLEVDSEGGSVVAVASTLEGAQQAAEANRSPMEAPLTADSWESYGPAERPTWLGPRTRGYITRYEIAEWPVDSATT